MLGLIFILAFGSVSITPTSADSTAVARLLDEAHLPLTTTRTFAEDITLIRALQDRVLQLAPVNEGIPLGRSRELTDLARAGHGLCYDRSRAMEMALRVVGFDVRHVYVFAPDIGDARWRDLVHRQLPSHALTEVRTQRGWVMLDSNTPWIGLRADSSVVGVAAYPKELRARRVPLLRNLVMLREYKYLFGLYSRHGRFFAPYISIPDFNLSELLHNVQR